MKNTSRQYKYDAEMTEYFVETEDKVKISKADLERYVSSEAMEPADTVPQPEKKALLESKVPAIEDGVVDPPKTIGTVQETKENLDKFIESLHKKAACAIQWLAAVEPPAVEKPSERQLQFLAFLCYFFCVSR